MEDYRSEAEAKSGCILMEGTQANISFYMPPWFDEQEEI